MGIAEGGNVSGVIRRFNERCNALFPDFAVDHRIVASLLFILSLVLYVLFLNPGFFHHDSLLVLAAVKASVKAHSLQPQAFAGRYGEILVHIPIYLLAEALRIPVDVMFNFFNAFFGALAVVFLYLFVREFTKEEFLALASSLLLAVNPVFFSLATFHKNHTISVFLILASFYLLVKAGRDADGPVFLSGGLFIFSVFIRESNLFLLLPLCLFFFRPRISEKSLVLNKPKVRNAICLFSPILVGGALFWIFQHSFIVHQAAYGSFLGLFSPLFLMALRDLSVDLTLIGCLLFFVGLVYGLRKRPALTVYLFCWILPSFFYYANVSIYLIRYFMEILPALIILVALGLLWIFRVNKIFSGIALCALMVSMFVFIYPIVSSRHSFSGEKDYALWLKTQTEKDAVVISMDDGVFVNFYGERRAIGHPVSGNAVAINEWVGELNSLLNGGINVYLMESGLSYDPGRLVAKALEDNYSIGLVGRHRAEDYHHSEIRLAVYDEGLFKIARKK